jgi:hypothetical protein
MSYYLAEWLSKTSAVRKVLRTKKKNILFEISSSHCGEYEDDILGCCAVTM